VTIIGFVTFAFGVLLVGSALYAKFMYSNYSSLSDSIPAGGIWYILGVGAFIALCGIMLMLAVCCNDEGVPKPFFKMVLIIGSFVLLLMLILEISAGSLLVYSLGIMGQEDADGPLASDIINDRNKFTNATFTKCCIEFTPPYTSTNASVVDDVCKWPEWNSNVATKCKDDGKSSNVLECACSSTPEYYGSLFGAMLQGAFLWIGVVAISFAICLIFGVIWTCYLGWKHCCTDKSRHEYNPNQR